MARKRITVIRETDTGRNIEFRDNYNGRTMSRSQFVWEIKQWNYPKYHIRNINKIETPVSNPDNTTNNNLG